MPPVSPRGRRTLQRRLRNLDTSVLRHFFSACPFAALLAQPRQLHPSIDHLQGRQLLFVTAIGSPWKGLAWPCASLRAELLTRFDGVGSVFLVSCFSSALPSPLLPCLLLVLLLGVAIHGIPDPTLLKTFKPEALCILGGLRRDSLAASRPARL